jgi:hypothetical protein
MPATQRGTVDKPGSSWRARWSDENLARREKRGFRTKSEARKWLSDEVERVRKKRIDRPVKTGADRHPISPRTERHVEATVVDSATGAGSNGTPERLGEFLLKAPQVAAILRVSTRWVYEQAKAHHRGDPGGLPNYRFGNSTRGPVRFKWQDIEAWMERNQSREAPVLRALVQPTAAEESS